MSIYTITIDSLMKLDKTALAYALRVFQQELAGMLRLLATEDAAHEDEQVLDDLNQLLTLRKVFTLRLAELEAEAAASDGATPLALAA